MTPNHITAIRVLMAFGAVALFGRSAAANLTALLLTVSAVALDAVDGYVARRKKLSTPLGAHLDILGDRVIENLFFTYFAVCGLISIWVPVIFFVRGTFTDFIRGLAARDAHTAFGSTSSGGVASRGMMETRWGHALVVSRFSRAAYGILKCVCFCYLGAQLTLVAAARHGDLPSLARLFEQWSAEFFLGAHVLTLITLAFCLVRGLPVLWEGQRYLAALETSPAHRGTLAGVAAR